MAKRVKVTATGKIKRRKAFHSHLLSSKSPKQKMNLAKAGLVHKTNAKNIKCLVPYL